MCSNRRYIMTVIMLSICFAAIVLGGRAFARQPFDQDGNLLRLDGTTPITSEIVATSDTQTLSNKTLDSSNSITAEAITSGTLSDARLSGSIVRTNKANTFEGYDQIFDDNTFIVNASTDTVSIGTTETSEKLNVLGSVKIGTDEGGTVRALKKLVMRQDGDLYGPSILTLVNRNSQNGAMFETTDPAITLIDFLFITGTPDALSKQRNIRLEARSASARTGSPSFHIGGGPNAGNPGGTDPDNPSLSVGDYYSAVKNKLVIGSYSQYSQQLAVTQDAYIGTKLSVATTDAASDLTVNGTAEIITGTSRARIDASSVTPGQTRIVPAGTGIPSSLEVFTSSLTWTRPAGVSKVYVQVWGGGGAGVTGSNNSSGGGGGGGGYSAGLVSVNGNVNVTVGAGGGTSGASGGSSSFAGGTTLTGAGGSGATTVTGGAGGAGSGGTINLTGGSGGISIAQDASSGAPGGGSPLGGAGGSGGCAAKAATTGISVAGRAGTSPGGGGGGGSEPGGAFGAGAAGLVIIMY